MSSDFLLALYVFCMDHHSGQWSRGYRIMSRFSRLDINLTDALIEELRASETYERLRIQYKDKV
jgi:hypothetical protein